MKSDLLSIGKMAELNHISIATLRLYDKMGLLRPRYTDPMTGYRYYDIQQNARLDMIAYMKELGMSLSEIGDVLQKEDVTLIEEILAQKNEQIHDQIRELRVRHDAVERAINCLERYRKSPSTGTISLEYIDQRYIWAIPCDENFYEKDISSYEHVLATLRQALLSQGFTQIHSYNTGTSIAKTDFEEGKFIPKQVFIFSERRLEHSPGAAVIESGMYACIYLDNYDDEIACAEKLLRFCRDNHYIIAGDYVCEVLTEFNVFDSDRRSMFLRLQVPVTFLRNNGKNA